MGWRGIGEIAGEILSDLSEVFPRPETGEPEKAVHVPGADGDKRGLVLLELRMEGNCS